MRYLVRCVAIVEAALLANYLCYMLFKVIVIHV